MTVTARDLLTKARTVIADPAHWTTGTYARDADGVATQADSPYAKCFCTYGAVQRAAVELRARPASVNEAYQALQDQAHTGSWSYHTVATINDQLGHEAALKLLDHSIEAARP